MVPSSGPGPRRSGNVGLLNVTILELELHRHRHQQPRAAEQVNAPSSPNNPATVPAMLPTRFHRLFKP
jgi:hypothetical protein